MMSSLAEKLAEKMANRRVLLDHAIVQFCPVPCFVLQLTGACDSANERFLKMTGFSQKELVRRGIATVVHPDDAPDFHDTLASAVDNGTNFRNYSHRIRPKKGPIVNVFTDLFCVEGAGFVGFSLPVCGEPHACPLHHTLLGNVPGS